MLITDTSTRNCLTGEVSLSVLQTVVWTHVQNCTSRQVAPLIQTQKLTIWQTLYTIIQRKGRTCNQCRVLINSLQQTKRKSLHLTVPGLESTRFFLLKLLSNKKKMFMFTFQEACKPPLRCYDSIYA